MTLKQASIRSSSYGNCQKASPLIGIAQDDLQQYWAKMGEKKILSHKDVMRLQKHLDEEGLQVALIATFSLLTTRPGGSVRWSTLGREIGSEEVKLAVIEELRPHIIAVLHLIAEGSIAWVLTITQHAIPVASAAASLLSSLVIFAGWLAVCHCKRRGFPLSLLKQKS